MSYIVKEKYISEEEISELLDIFNDCNKDTGWHRSIAVSSEYNSDSTTTSRIAESIRLREDKLPEWFRDRLCDSATKLSGRKAILNEDLTIQKYLGSRNGKFDWHQDILNWFIYSKDDLLKTPEELFIKNTRPKRMVSASIALEDYNDYEGGQFVLDKGDGKKSPVNLNKGDMVMFTSETFHGVEPVTKGDRNAIIIWLISYEEYIQWKQLCDIDTERE